jgi:hypothetical protein
MPTKALILGIFTDQWFSTDNTGLYLDAIEKGSMMGNERFIESSSVFSCKEQLINVGRCEREGSLT